MKTARILTILVVVLGMMVSLVQVSKAEPMGTGWAYQGRLIDANSAADGEYDFEFKLFDANTAGNQQGSTINEDDVDVIDGYFTVALDFGAGVFDGDAVWLETAVRPGDSVDGNDFVTLSPRQEVTPTPYAVYAENAGGDGDWTISDNSMYSAVSGNVGIGTTNPLSKLSVVGDGTDHAGVSGHMSGQSASGVGIYGTSTSGQGVKGSGGTFGVYGIHDSSGNYGYLGSSICGVYGSSNGGTGVVGYSNTGIGVYGSSLSGYAGYFSGNVRVVYGDVYIPNMMSWPWPAGGYNVKWDGAGDGYLFYESSSARYKENIEPCREDFGKILQAEVKSYACKKTGRRGIGFIAEELDELGLCELVIYDQEGRPDAIAYEMISLYLLEVLKDEVEASREQEKAINQLVQKNRKLEERVDALERMMQGQQSVLAKLVQK